MNTVLRSSVWKAGYLLQEHFILVSSCIRTGITYQEVHSLVQEEEEHCSCRCLRGREKRSGEINVGCIISHY